MGILEDKEDEDVYNDFICYLNKRLNELYNKLYNSKIIFLLKTKKTF